MGVVSNHFVSYLNIILNINKNVIQKPENSKLKLIELSVKKKTNFCKAASKNPS